MGMTVGAVHGTPWFKLACLNTGQIVMMQKLCDNLKKTKRIA